MRADQLVRFVVRRRRLGRKVHSARIPPRMLEENEKGVLLHHHRSLITLRGASRARCQQSAVPAERGASRAWCQQSVVPAERGASRAWCQQSVVPAERGASRAWCQQSIAHSSAAINCSSSDGFLDNAPMTKSNATIPAPMIAAVIIIFLTAALNSVSWPSFFLLTRNS